MTTNQEARKLLDFERLTFILSAVRSLTSGYTRLKTPLLLVIVTLLMATACAADDGPDPTAVGADGDGTLSVVHRNYEFKPERLAFSVGETVDFKLRSADDVHTFTVKELGINWVVRGDAEPQTQTYTFDRAGTFQLICAIPGHQGFGMVGTLTVQ
jgi:plastocyanin